MQHNTLHESCDILPVRDNEDYVDLRLLAAQIWKTLKLILTGIIMIVAAALLTNEFLRKYCSEDHVKIISMSPDSYKGFQPIFWDVNRCRAYVVKEGVSDKNSITFMEGLLSLPFDMLERYISFPKSISSKDGKENLVVKGKDGEPELGPVFVGMDLRIPGPSPAAAQLRSRLIAEQFADAFIYSDLLKRLDSIGPDREAAV